MQFAKPAWLQLAIGSVFSTQDGLSRISLQQLACILSFLEVAICLQQRHKASSSVMVIQMLVASCQNSAAETLRDQAGHGEY